MRSAGSKAGRRQRMIAASGSRPWWHMYVVINIIRVRREHQAEFLTAIREHARRSSAEPGCLRYDVLQDLDDPQVISLYEVFEDEAAFRAHLDYPHYRHWMSQSASWRHDERRIRHVLDFVYRSEAARGEPRG